MKWFFFISLLFTTLLQAEHVRWQGDYEKAREEAVKEKKFLMVLLIEDECTECIEMLRVTFRDQPYVKGLNERYISVLVRRGQKESYPIELLYATTYPSLFFLTSKETFEREPITGYADPAAFEKHLELH